MKWPSSTKALSKSESWISWCGDTLGSAKIQRVSKFFWAQGLVVIKYYGNCSGWNTLACWLDACSFLQEDMNQIIKSRSKHQRWFCLNLRLRWHWTASAAAAQQQQQQPRRGCGMLQLSRCPYLQCHSPLLLARELGKLIYMKLVQHYVFILSQSNIQHCSKQIYPWNAWAQGS